MIGANWRGFYASGGMSDRAYDYWVHHINAMYDSALWKGEMALNGLAPLGLFGKEFEEFVQDNVRDIAQISRSIGIKNQE